MLEEKNWFMTQRRQTIRNLGINLHIDFYEKDNHVELYKDIVKNLKKFKNRCRRDGRRNAPINQNSTKFWNNLQKGPCVLSFVLTFVRISLLNY